MYAAYFYFIINVIAFYFANKIISPYFIYLTILSKKGKIQM